MKANYPPLKIHRSENTQLESVLLVWSYISVSPTALVKLLSPIRCICCGWAKFPFSFDKTFLDRVFCTILLGLVVGVHFSISYQSCEASSSTTFRMEANGMMALNLRNHDSYNDLLYKVECYQS